MAESALSVRTIAAKHRIHIPMSVKSDILGFGGRRSPSLRQTLARMQLPFIEDVKYCNPNRLDEFDIHFVVIAPTHDSSGNPYLDARGNPIAVPTADNTLFDPATGPLSGADVFKREVDILNEFFTMDDGNGGRTPVAKDGHEIRFRYKSHHYSADIRHTGEGLLQYGRQEDWDKLCQDGYYGKNPNANPNDYLVNPFFADHVWLCNDRRFVDPLAINIFIFDWMEPDCGDPVNRPVNPHNNTSGGSDNKDPSGRNGYRPYILLDWFRLFHNHLSPEEHEMGHVFDLHHNLNPNEEVGSSNIMQGRPLRAGLRDKGFGIIQHEEYHIGQNFDQVEAIMEMAWKLQNYWGEVYRRRWPRS